MLNLKEKDRITLKERERTKRGDGGERVRERGEREGEREGCLQLL